MSTVSELYQKKKISVGLSKMRHGSDLGLFSEWSWQDPIDIGRGSVFLIFLRIKPLCF